MKNKKKQKIDYTEINTHETKYLLKRFMPYFKKYKAVLVIDLFCALLTTVCELVFPMIVRLLTNLGVNDPDSLTVKLIVEMGLVYLGLRVLDSAAYFFMAYVGHVMGARIETDMRSDLFEHIQKLSFSYFDNTKIGQLMGRITSDLFDITEFAHHCPEEYFIAAVKITGSFIICANMNVPLTLVIFVIVPIMLICSLSFRTKMRVTSKISRHQIGELNAQAEDSMLGIRVVKSFGNEAIETEKFERGNRAFLANKKLMYKYFAGFQTTTRVFDGVMYLAAVVAGSLFIVWGKINAADLIAYLLYISTLLTSIRRIVEFNEQFQKGITGIERFIEVMDVKPEIKDSPNAVTLSEVRGDVVFDDVSFGYESDDKKVLSHINLSVDHGKNVALVGPSGAGKTTLCSLIPRFYDVSGGSLRIDGINIKDVSVASLRKNIGVVQQDVYMFSGTIFENIEYGLPGASEDAVIDAAKKAGIHDFIMSLPDGYSTNAGERGVKLSGGQKQRISIARVFLKNPPILILDEATSSLDNESERIVRESLEKLSDGRTTFTIAHRLTTIRNAELILVLTEDGIVEQGTHRELMVNKGVYYNLNILYNS